MKIVVATLILLLSSAPPPTPLERCSVGVLRDNPQGYVWSVDSIQGFVDRADDPWVAWVRARIE